CVDEGKPCPATRRLFDSRGGFLTAFFLLSLLKLRSNDGPVPADRDARLLVFQIRIEAADLESLDDRQSDANEKQQQQHAPSRDHVPEAVAIRTLHVCESPIHGNSGVKGTDQDYYDHDGL